LEKIAVICHKYDCVDAVRVWYIIWVAGFFCKIAVVDYATMLMPTYLPGLVPEICQVPSVWSGIVSIFSSILDN
jgi:hypothetical protein